MNMELLTQVLTAYGATGREGGVRAVIERALGTHADSVRTDAMGNFIAVKKGDGTGKRIMLSSHMDHIALVVIDADEHGFLRVCAAGGVPAGKMVAQHVAFGNGEMGVVGADGDAPAELTRICTSTSARTAARRRLRACRSGSLPSPRRAWRGLASTGWPPRRWTTASRAMRCWRSSARLRTA